MQRHDHPAQQIYRHYRGSLRGLFIGVLVLVGLVVAVSHLGEAARLVEHLRNLSGGWLVIAAVFQFGTYWCTAGPWYCALRAAGATVAWAALVPLAVGKLFSDQIVPSAGASGNAFFLAALTQLGISAPQCTATLWIGLISFFGAQVLMAVLSLCLMVAHGALSFWAIGVTLTFCLIAGGIPLAVLQLRRAANHHANGHLITRLCAKLPWLVELLRILRDAPNLGWTNQRLLFQATVLQCAAVLLDAATLWAMLHAIGQAATLWMALPAVVFASMAAKIGMVPLGLGTFEATCIAMLHTLGVPLEASLSATLLLRAYTTWLPMLPGVWLVRRTLGGRQAT